ncbi:MAG: ATP-binding protein [Chloroflexi bacterium]|nr:ATP-binding protein [Chloroflexota bacterium]
MKISVCGKGGSGKSTLVSLLASEAQAMGLRVVVIDSDESNSGLFRMLGFARPPVPLMELLGGKKGLKQRMGRPDVLEETRIYVENIPPQHIAHRDGLALLSVGKILQALEGCACPMGVLSREFVNKLKLRENEIAIVDMEAGVEHFGRGIDTGIDTVLAVVEPSLESIILAEKIKGLAAGRNSFWAVLNKVDSEALAARLTAEMEKRGVDVIAAIPTDPEVFEAGLEGHIVGRGKASAEAKKALDFLLSKQRGIGGDLCA